MCHIHDSMTNDSLQDFRIMLFLIAINLLATMEQQISQIVSGM